MLEWWSGGVMGGGVAGATTFATVFRFFFFGGMTIKAAQRRVPFGLPTMTECQRQRIA